MQKFGVNIMENKKEPNETKFSKIRIEREQRDHISDLRSDRTINQCCFKKRYVDLFIMNVARSFSQCRIPKELVNIKKDVFPVINIDESPSASSGKLRVLADAEAVWNFLRLIGYCYKIREAGDNEESDAWKNSHKIIIDGQLCTEIAEEYFKGGWSIPINNSFLDIINAESPDNRILLELDIFNDEDESNEEDLLEDIDFSEEDI
jgi:hypothetical protein